MSNTVQDLTCPNIVLISVVFRDTVSCYIRSDSQNFGLELELQIYDPV